MGRVRKRPGAALLAAASPLVLPTKIGAPASPAPQKHSSIPPPGTLRPQHLHLAAAPAVRGRKQPKLATGCALR